MVPTGVCRSEHSNIDEYLQKKAADQGSCSAFGFDRGQLGILRNQAFLVKLKYTVQKRGAGGESGWGKT
jgi:hypothetical protein